MFEIFVFFLGGIWIQATKKPDLYPYPVPDHISNHLQIRDVHMICVLLRFPVSYRARAFSVFPLPSPPPLVLNQTSIP